MWSSMRRVAGRDWTEAGPSASKAGGEKDHERPIERGKGANTGRKESERAAKWAAEHYAMSSPYP